MRWCIGDAMNIGDRMSVGEGTQLPIDVWVDPFEPRHSQDHLVAAEWSDKEGFLVFNTSKGKFESDHVVSMMKFCSIRDGD